ncbi:MAG TPA: 4a-hydroxytetrahydrobiopterin dehydratase [Phycisphaerae bacterium]|nr:4a-hydroxytetrahydrobiopterin dehydratase [Phycisphaerae bacterium]
MTTTLTTKKCQACASAEGKLTDTQIAELMGQVADWRVENGELRRTFKFKDNHESIAFVNATAWISHSEDHHPDIELGYNKVTMRYSTHSVGGLTENDFICAAKVNALLSV